MSIQQPVSRLEGESILKYRGNCECKEGRRLLFFVAQQARWVSGEKRMEWAEAENEAEENVFDDEGMSLPC